MLTAWDGHVRIDVEPDLLRLTTLTIESTTELQLRPGLVASFVSTDPHGPPAALTVELLDGTLPADVAELLGTRLTAALSAVVDTRTEPYTDWVRLNLAELDELAAAWAPYRARVLATVATPDVSTPHAGWRAVVGTWAGELWTSLGGPELAAALDRIDTTLIGNFREPKVVYRGDSAPDEPDSAPDEPAEPPEEIDPSAPSGSWRIPAELAMAAGVEPDLTWWVWSGDEGVTLIVMARRTDSPPSAQLLVGWDDASAGWVALTPDPIGSLSAELTGIPGSAIGGVRLRTVTAADGTRK